MGYSLLIFCLLAVLSGSNARTLDAEAIIGRMSAAKPVKYFVTIKHDGKPTCRGGIIGNRFILTAASCVLDKTTNDLIPGLLSIVAGNANNTVVVDVDKIYLPKDNFADRSQAISDIAVLKLKKKLDIRGNRKTLQQLMLPRLRSNGFKSFSSESVKIATFEEEYQIDLPYLLSAKVVDESECVARWNRTLRKNELCGKIEDASSAPTKMCQNDLGSPLVFNNKVVIGIAIVPSDRCILNGEPSIYTRVSSFLPFIKAARSGKGQNAFVKVL